MLNQAFVQIGIDLYSIQIPHKLEIFIHFKDKLILNLGLIFEISRINKMLENSLASFGSICIMIIALREIHIVLEKYCTNVLPVCEEAVLDRVLVFNPNQNIITGIIGGKV